MCVCMVCACVCKLEMCNYCIVKYFGSNKVRRIGVQNSFGGENLNRLTIYTEGNQGKEEEKLADKSLANWLSIAKFTKVFYCQIFLLYNI